MSYSFLLFFFIIGVELLFIRVSIGGVLFVCLFLLEYFYFPGSSDGGKTAHSVGDPGLIRGFGKIP